MINVNRVCDFCHNKILDTEHHEYLSTQQTVLKKTMTFFALVCIKCFHVIQYDLEVRKKEEGAEVQESEHQD